MKRPSYVAAGILGALTLAAGAEEVLSGREPLPEIVVTAEADSAIPDHFAGSATVIGEEEIKASGVRSVAELLAAKGGVRLTSTSGNASGSSVHLRGFGENAASRVLILVDGRPVNRPDMGAVSLLEVPLSRIARVEILRGAQTARFGDHAVGGVINLVTRRAKEGGEGYVEGAGGSDGYGVFRLGYGKELGGQGVRVDLERNFTDGWRENAASEIESAYFRWDRTLGRSGRLDLGAGWSDEFTEFPGPLDGARYRDDPRQSIYEEYGQADQYFSEQTRWQTEGSLSFGREEGKRFEAPLAWTRRELSWNFGPGSHIDHTLDSLAARPALSFSGEGWRVETGLNWRYDRLDLAQFAEIRRRNRTAEAELSRWVWGGWAAADWEPWKSWHLNLAARVEGSRIGAKAESLSFPWDPSLNFDRSGSGLDHAFQAGLRWEGERGISAWLRYDRLYRLPSTDEIASYQGYPMSEPFNDRLEAETGDQVELGAEWTRGDWRLRVNGFAQWMEGEIAYDYLRNLNVNFADTKRQGIETEIGYRSDLFDATLRHVWLTAKFGNGAYRGKSVYLVPEHEFSAVAAWKPAEGWLLQAEYQYVGSSYEGNDLMNERPKLPDHGVANAMVRREWRNGFSVFFRVNNLADEHYATVKYNGVWYPAAGRQYQLGARKEF